MAIRYGQDGKFWFIALALAAVAAMEFATPPNYVFSYLYIVPVAFSSFRLSRRATLGLTIAAASLTLLNLILPGGQPVAPETLPNRAIAAAALLVTGWLSDRVRYLTSATIQQQAQLQSQAQLAQMRADFISTLTHDLKTPLLGAIETLQALMQGKFGAVTASGQKVLEMVIRSHQTSLHLVGTMLDVYRNEAEGLQLQAQKLNLAALAQEAIALLSDFAANRQVYLALSYGESDFRRNLWVEGDAFQLQRVFANLLANGIEHSPRGGRVEIVLESLAGAQLVQVLDAGSGIPETELPHLFERFYQGQSDRQAKGSGLGLYLSRQIIEAHGGTIWAEKRLPRGAAFIFRLPACPPLIDKAKGNDAC